MIDIMEKFFRRIQDASAVRFHYVMKHINYHLRVIGPRNAILDVGCGNKPFRDSLSFKDYISVDLDASVEPDIVADICHLPFRDGIVDAIICTEVLEHIMDTDKALQELYRVSKPRAYLHLTTPFLFGVHDTKDFYRWTEDGLKEVLRRNGFKVIDLQKDGGVFASIGELMRQALYQVFGPYTNRRNWLKYLFLAGLYLLLIPLTKLLILLDRADLKKNFTTGYTVLALK